MRLSYTSFVTSSLSIGVGLVVGGVVGLALMPIQLLGNGVELLTGSQGVEIGTSTEERLAEAVAQFQAERDDASNTNGTTATHTPKRSRRTDESTLNGMAR